jgi:hypothetical protein
MACLKEIINSGLPTCVLKPGVLDGAIFVPTYDANKNLNAILDTDVLNAAFFADKVSKATPKDQRWYPLDASRVEDVSYTEDDPISQTFSSGRIEVLNNGAVNISLIYVDVPPSAKQFFEKTVKGQESSVYLPDNEGQLMGKVSADGTKFLPLRMNKGSLNVKFTPKNLVNTQTNQLEVTFQLNKSEQSEFFEILAVDGVDFTTLTGMLDVDATISLATVGSFTADTKLKYNRFLGDLKLEGRITADWELYNETQATGIIITSATEQVSSPGVYDFVFSTQTSADVLTLTLADNTANANFELTTTTIVTP